MSVKKRRRIWIGLLLIAALSVPGNAVAQANEEYEEPQLLDELHSGETYSMNRANEELHPEVSGDFVSSVSGENVEIETVSDDTVISENDESGITLSENSEDVPEVLSDNDVSLNEVRQEKSTDSNESSAEEVYKKPVNVVLPVEVPFDIVLFGEDGLDALIKSDQYCIENKGYEDVRVSIHGICSGENVEDYEVSESSVEEEYAQGKKNVWIYLKWEDENRETLERPKIVMGDSSAPGEGQIVLKAPKRDKKGNIKGENLDSKAYFSFAGDMKSDMEQAWRSGELKVDLNFSMDAEDSTEVNKEELLDMPEETPGDENISYAQEEVVSDNEE